MKREVLINEDGKKQLTLTLTEEEFKNNCEVVVCGLENTVACILGSEIVNQLYSKLFYDKTYDEIQEIIKDKNHIIYDNKLGIIYGELGEATDLYLNGKQLIVGDLVEYRQVLTKKEIKKGKQPRIDISIVCKDYETGKYFIYGSRKKCFEHKGDLCDLLSPVTNIEKIKSCLDLTSETKIYDKRISVKKEEN